MKYVGKTDRRLAGGQLRSASSLLDSIREPMLFNSNLFIFLFLPLALLGWFGLNHFRLPKGAECFLLGMNLWFYGCFHPEYLLLILASLLGNYLLSALYRKEWRLPFLILGVGFNLGLLFYFKYFDFLMENLAAVFSGGGFSPAGILLPLGISFFTFQQLSFILDRAAGKAEHYPFLYYANFITFFPQLVAGPIVLHEEFIPQFKAPEGRVFNSLNFARGVERFVLGLSKKVLLADPLSQTVAYGYERIWYLDSVSALVLMITFAFQLYFDFSGYCDMALGIGRMFNLTLPENFLSPYKSASMQELWQRWHITLSRFFTTYVYYPLGGSRRGEARVLFNVMVVFFLSGIWHGANWTFVLWGLIQGVGVCVSGSYKRAKERGVRLPEIPRRAAVLITFLYFALSLGVFRSDDLFLAGHLFRHLLTPEWTGFLLELASSFKLPEVYVLARLITMKAPDYLPWLYAGLFAFWMGMCTRILIGRNTAELTEDHWGRKSSSPRPVLLGLLFFWCVISLSRAGEFLYFNF